ncbi:TPA: 50S ribosomal protein L29 [bacterium]|nr:50S ribosomal protein L29 [bacterium]
MKAREVREMTTEELGERKEEFNKELLNLRYQVTIGQLENPRRLRTVKRILARIKTVLRERELGLR